MITFDIECHIAVSAFPGLTRFLEASGFLKTPQKATQSVYEQASAQALMINHILNQVTYVLKCLILKINYILFRQLKHENN